MKKNIIYLLILVALGIAAFFAFRDREASFSKDEANFKVENIEEVTQIFLSDAGVGNIKMTKDNDGTWYINDSFRARQDWVAFLLKGMAEQNAVQPVPQSAHNTTVKALAGNSVKVEVYKGDKKTNAYYVGKDPSKDNLTVMLNIKDNGKNAERPFLVQLGHSSTFMGVRYGTDLQDWRDKRILNFPKSKLKSLRVTYPKKPKASFTMLVEPKLSIQPALEGGEVNELRLEKYRGFFNSFYCLGFENDYILKDTFIKAFSPFAQVQVTSTEGDTHQLDLYYRQINKTTHNVIKVDGVEYDGDTFFAWYDEKDFLLISMDAARRMLRERQEFYSTKE